MPDPKVPVDVQEIAKRLAGPKPMRRGSLSERYIKCNKPGCRCADDPKARHGPYTSVVRTVGKQTQSKSVPAAKAELARQQVEEGQRFRKDVNAYWDACERWADAELKSADETTRQDAEKKRGSQKPSKRKSSPKSRR